MSNDKADEVIKELLKSPLSRYQLGLETSRKGIYFILCCVHLLYYKCHEVNLNPSDWIKTKNNNKSYK